MSTITKTGVVSDRGIGSMVARGELRPAASRGGSPAFEGQIQPASMDLTLGQRAYETSASFLPGRGIAVAQRLPAVAVRAFDLRDGAVLEPGKIYLFEAGEALRLAPDVSAKANPKSSTGRLDVFVRVICDGADRFDCIPEGYAGSLWIEVVPLTFPVRVALGSRLTQVRFRRGDARLDDQSLRQLHGREPLVDSADMTAYDGLTLSLNLVPDEDGIVGWEARSGGGEIDVDRVGYLDPASHWEPVRPRAGGDAVLLRPGSFYILASRECVRVPLDYAAEMIPFDAGVGEIRSHYAGFFDPGFGVERDSRAVLEVRAHDVPFLVVHGQIVAKLVYERMFEPPTRPYGSTIGSNYQGQRLRLSKHFF